MSALKVAAGTVLFAFVLAACMTNSGAHPQSPQSAAASRDAGCPTQTGSPWDQGTVCAVYGRSYSREAIDLTGATTAGGALRLLDPSITIQH